MVMFFGSVVAVTQLSGRGKPPTRGFRHLERGIGGAIIAPLVRVDRGTRVKCGGGAAPSKEPGGHVMAITWPGKTNKHTASP